MRRMRLRRVADSLGIPFYAVNFAAEFARIIDYFVDRIHSRSHAEPLHRLQHVAQVRQVVRLRRQYWRRDTLPTGHYARLEPLEGSQVLALCRGVDESKDQSYVLFGVHRGLLERLMFPVGSHRKEEIRQIAVRLGLRVAAKPDSQEICFVPDGNHARLVRDRRPTIDTAGEIVTTDGNVVGRHEGLERFTIGQAKDFAWLLASRYVVRLEPETRA